MSLSFSSGRVVCGIALGAALMVGSVAQGAVIVSDTFTAANSGTFIPGSGVTSTRAPAPTNLPGGTYVVTGGGGGDGRIQGNTGQVHNGGGVGIALGAYNDATTLTVSADVFFVNTAAPIQTSGFGLLGFFNTASTAQYQGALGRFTGLRFNLDGSLQLYVQGTATGAAVAFAGGTYDPAVAQNLSFTVDTVLGTLTGVSFGASTASYAFATTGVTEARTEYVGFAGSLGNTPNWIGFDNFLVDGPIAVPEPTSLVTVAVAIGATLLRRRRAQA